MDNSTGSTVRICLCNNLLALSQNGCIPCCFSLKRNLIRLKQNLIAVSRWWMLSLPELKSLISQSNTNRLFRPPHLDKDLFVLFCELLIIIWLIQVKDGKLLDEMAVGMTGLANKVGRADICRSVQTQNQFPHSPQCSASGRSSRI